MDDLFQNILDTEYIEEVFDAIDNKSLQDYYALFISAMAYCHFINISQEFSAKLYVNILHTSIKDSESILNDIFNFLINKSINDLEKEINND